MFADDVCAWPAVSMSRLDSQFRCLRLFLEHLTEWSEVWKLEFSVDKTQIVLFHRKRNSPTTPTNLMLCNRQVSFARSYKYLGVLMDSNGTFNSHVTQLITKTKFTAHQISQIFHRNRAPTPIIARKLVHAILIPQIAYGLQFIVDINAKHKHHLTQVLATPLRRSLCLPRTTSAQRVIWEFGLPDVGSIHLRALLQFYNRSCIHLSSDSSSLPAQFALDVRNYVPIISSPPLFQSLPSLLLSCLDSPHLSHKSINTIIQNKVTQHWERTARHSYRVFKPCSDIPTYLSVSECRNPSVVIRGRIRMDADLSHKRMCQYRSTDSPNCPNCSVVGDSQHMLMLCPLFCHERKKCQEALRRLYFPVELTMSLIYGEPPPPPNDRTLHNEKAFLHGIHVKCLQITSNFLAAVSAKHFL